MTMITVTIGINAEEAQWDRIQKIETAISETLSRLGYGRTAGRYGKQVEIEFQSVVVPIEEKYERFI